MKDKKGLSTIVITLIIILISLVAIGIIWLVVRNIIQVGTNQIALGQFTLDVKIKDFAVDTSSNNVSLTLKRSSGGGEISGIKFIFSDGKNSETIIEEVPLAPLEERRFILHLVQLNVSDLVSISIFAIVNQNGEESIGNVLDEYNIEEEFSAGQEGCSPGFQDCDGDTSCECDLSSNYCLAGSCTAIVHLECGDLNSAGTTYILTSNVNSSGTCFNVTAPDVTLDCNGYIINYSQEGAQFTYGIFTNRIGTIVRNCNVYDGNWTTTNTARYGIIYGSASHGTILNNRIVTSNSPALYIYSTAANNTLINNVGISNKSNGIELRTAHNNTLINNIGISNSTQGIGLYVSSYNNTFINCVGISDRNYGVRLDSSYNNKFYGLTALSSAGSDSYGVYLSTSSGSPGNNLFQDCINVSGVTGDLYSRGTYPNQVFINCSYNTSKEVIGVGAEIIRKWYYKAYVQNSGGNPVLNANVSARNSTSSLILSELFTDSSGWTGIATIIDYVNNGTRKYYGNYNVSATNNIITDSHTYNITRYRNNLTDSFTL